MDINRERAPEKQEHIGSLALSANQIEKVFPRKNGNLVTALSKVDIRVPYGKKVALIGPGGAGKTTLLRIACGLLSPTKGTMTVLGKETDQNTSWIQSKLGYMPQRFGLYEDLSVLENMNLYADLHAISKDIRSERIHQLLSMTGLEKFTTRLAGRLSGGMKQKLGLACTLIRMPPLLLLDEPTVGVDPLSRRELWEIVNAVVKKEKMAVLVSTGYMEEAEEADIVYIIHEGHILSEGTPKEIIHKATSRCFSAIPPEGVPARYVQAAFLDHEDVLDAVPDGHRVRLTMREGKNIHMFKQDPLFSSLSIVPAKPRLEDSFMMYLHKASGAVDTTEYERKSFTIVNNKRATELQTIDIEVHDLVRQFGDFTAVDRTSFSVYNGEIFGLLGPNGAGKTTTFRMLCGLLPATSGTLLVAGKDLRKAPAEARRNIGYVAQKFSLYTMLSVRENLDFFGGAYGLSKKERKERIPEILEEFQLTDVSDSLTGSLPLGYKQRLSMAAALLHRPRILFLDEATSGIDPIARRSFWRRITDIAAKGTTVVITTHFMEEAAYCDRIMIQDQGQTIAIGTPVDIMEQAHADDMNEAFIRIVEDKRKERRK